MRRYMDLWPCTDGDRQHLIQLLGLGLSPPASGGVVPGQPPLQAPPVHVQATAPAPAAFPPPAAAAMPNQAMPPSPGGLRQPPAGGPPPVLAPPPGGAHQPITQIPRELGNLMNALPPVHVSIILVCALQESSHITL